MRSFEYQVLLRYDTDFESFLDMLRYDQAVVVAWQPWNRERYRYGWRVTLQSDRFSIERWHSFMLYPVDAQGEPIK